ncbi:hypothetical protein BOTCAL_0712g00040 [Botryotinia calthae]|uniref:Uncharacterized protein n=1 Tax=Botryotinia calthae TaxID=38488 RepID=A0A4Y8CGX8_9HELO|nr:hypothetical protein BOTCAL_0712g00040 [Botryotinia calthae]
MSDQAPPSPSTAASELESPLSDHHANIDNRAEAESSPQSPAPSPAPVPVPIKKKRKQRQRQKGLQPTRQSARVKQQQEQAILQPTILVVASGDGREKRTRKLSQQGKESRDYLEREHAEKEERKELAAGKRWNSKANRWNKMMSKGQKRPARARVRKDVEMKHLHACFEKQRGF